MPRTALLVTLVVSLSASASTPTRPTTEPTTRPVRVAVYADVGSSPAKLVTMLEGVAGLKVTRVTAEQIRGGALDGADVVLHPGGSGGKQGNTLGEEGRRRVRAFVERGGGYVGICAGAYLATCDYPWSLHILDAKVIDRQHWARGSGNVDVSLSEAGRRLLGASAETCSILYFQGPLLAPAENAGIPDYERLGVYETEIAKNGAPKGVMKGTTAIASAPFGKGRVFCFSPHPEKTPRLEQMLTRSIHWAARR